MFCVFLIDNSYFQDRFFGHVRQRENRLLRAVKRSDGWIPVMSVKTKKKRKEIINT